MYDPGYQTVSTDIESWKKIDVMSAPRLSKPEISFRFSLHFKSTQLRKLMQPAKQHICKIVQVLIESSCYPWCLPPPLIECKTKQAFIFSYHMYGALMVSIFENTTYSTSAHHTLVLSCTLRLLKNYMLTFLQKFTPFQTPYSRLQLHERTTASWPISEFPKWHFIEWKIKKLWLVPNTNWKYLLHFTQITAE